MNRILVASAAILLVFGVQTADASPVFSDSSRAALPWDASALLPDGAASQDALAQCGYGGRFYRPHHHYYRYRPSYYGYGGFGVPYRNFYRGGYGYGRGYYRGGGVGMYGPRVGLWIGF